LGVVAVWADAPPTPRASEAPARVTTASERRRGGQNDRIMDGPFPEENLLKRNGS
jgi:hypothetical protein